MAKQSGSTRISHWGSKGNYINDLYSKNGIRVEYGELDEHSKKKVKEKKNKLSKEVYQNLKDKIVKQVIDNGVEIEIIFTSSGIDHFFNSAMLTLSGKYFSEKSMRNIDKILSEAEYIPTSHELTKPRTDGRNLWFVYKAGGRDCYIKVDYNSQLKAYELYDVVDILK